jgi:hypothetical protein
MNINLAEAYVKERLNVSLPKFVREKAEAEGLYDYEIAEILNIDIPLVRRVRNISGIKRSNCFAKRFEERYGTGSINTFRNIVESPHSSLSDAARHFGFSREYARQVYKNIYEHPYTEVHREKLEIRRRQREDSKEANLWKQVRRRLSSITRVMLKAESLGYTVGFNDVLQYRRNPHNILVNGHKVAVMGTFGTTLKGKNAYFNFSRTNLDRKDCDFFICICHCNDIYYVIPYEAMPKKGFTIPADWHNGEPWPRRVSKYSQYRRAWNLLAGC